MYSVERRSFHSRRSCLKKPGHTKRKRYNQSSIVYTYNIIITYIYIFWRRRACFHECVYIRVKVPCASTYIEAAFS